MHRYTRPTRLALATLVASLLLALAPSVAVAAPPPGPTNVRPGDAVQGADQISLRWDPVAGATGYSVQIYDAVAQGFLPAVTTTQTSVVIDGVAPARLHLVFVAAIVGGNETAASSILFESLAGTPLAFGDVPATHAFAYHMQWLSAKGVTTGYGTPPNVTFQPSAPVLREQMAAFLYRLAGATDTATSCGLVDVPTTHVFAKQICWLRNEGISTGYATAGGTEFRGSQPVLREQMAAFLYRYAHESRVETDPPTFTDVPSTHAFFDEIEWLAWTEVTTGYPEAGGTKTFRGSQPVLREQMAAFLYRYSIFQPVG